MLQSVATLCFLLLAILAGGVIVSSLLADWAALRRAIGMAGRPFDALSPHIRLMPAPRRARMVHVTPAAPPVRAAA